MPRTNQSLLVQGFSKYPAMPNLMQRRMTRKAPQVMWFAFVTLSCSAAVRSGSPQIYSKSSRRGEGIFDQRGALLALDQVGQGRSMPTKLQSSSNFPTSFHREGLLRSLKGLLSQSTKAETPPHRATNFEASPTPPNKLRNFTCDKSSAVVRASAWGVDQCHSGSRY